jgi:hypothetical protein
MSMTTIKKMGSVAGVFLLVTLLVGYSFYSKDDYLADSKSFVSIIEVKYKNCSTDDWAKSDKKYRHFIGDYYEQYKEKLIDEDRRTIGNLKAKYRIVELKYNAGRVIDKVSEGQNRLDGFIEGVTESPLIIHKLTIL